MAVSRGFLAAFERRIFARKVMKTERVVYEESF